ncbi:hypothetical protein [Dactylosporangium sp. NPDC048998]|uniref:hypothetical protein n=1 Tax=Dactylosporangium sp. NPDC048998 TaxID=3363976 RepID=UPI003720EE5F
MRLGGLCSLALTGLLGADVRDIIASLARPRGAIRGEAMRVNPALRRILCLTSIVALAGALVSGTPAIAAPPSSTVQPAAEAVQPAVQVAPSSVGAVQSDVAQPAFVPVAAGGAVKVATAAACGGVLAFGEIAVCPAISGTRQDVFTVTTAKNSDKLYTMLTRGSGDYLQAFVTKGTTEVCFFGVDAGTCQLQQAGTYTITVKLYNGVGSGNYSLSVQSTRTPAACTTLSNSFFSFASTGVQKTLPAGSSGDCYKFNQPVGSVLRLDSPKGVSTTPGQYADVQGVILDAQFQPLCPVRYATNCTLTTAGPYFLNLFEYYGNQASYTLRMSRISNAAGCAPLRLAPFGDPGTNVGTGTVNVDGVACHQVHMPSAGTIGIRVYDGQQIFWYLYNNAGAEVCNSYANRRACTLSAAGDYFVMTLNQSYSPITYQIAAPALFRNAGCATSTGLSWAPDALLVHQTSAVQTNCQPFYGNAGDRVIAYAAPTVYNSVERWIVDSAGVQACPDYSGGEDGCLLPVSGTYRVISFLGRWDAESPDQIYKMQVRRLSQPVGCPVITPGTYNAAPAGALGPIRCRILNISTSGVYLAKAFDVDNYQTYAAVYDSTGHRVCADSSYCEIPAAGRYTMVLNAAVVDSVLDNDFSYVTALLPFQPSGCPTVSTNGFQDTPYQGAFTAPGQVLCRQLNSPGGSKIVQLKPTDATGSANPTGMVLDAAGNYVCDLDYNLHQTSCVLSGVAPMVLVLNERSGNAPGAFSMAFARVDGPPICPALPTGTTGSTVTTSATHYGVCFGIAADQHEASATFTWHRASGSGVASLSVFDANGNRYCGATPGYADRTVTCNYLPTGALTVVLETGAVDATYQLTRS